MSWCTSYRWNPGIKNRSKNWGDLPADFKSGSSTQGAGAVSPMDLRAVGGKCAIRWKAAFRPVKVDTPVELVKPKTKMKESNATISESKIAIHKDLVEKTLEEEDAYLQTLLYSLIAEEAVYFHVFPILDAWFEMFCLFQVHVSPGRTAKICLQTRGYQTCYQARGDDMHDMHDVHWYAMYGRDMLSKLVLQILRCRRCKMNSKMFWWKNLKMYPRHNMHTVLSLLISLWSHVDVVSTRWHHLNCRKTSKSPVKRYGIWMSPWHHDIHFQHTLTHHDMTHVSWWDETTGDVVTCSWKSLKFKSSTCRLGGDVGRKSRRGDGVRSTGPALIDFKILHTYLIGYLSMKFACYFETNSIRKFELHNRVWYG